MMFARSVPSHMLSCIVEIKGDKIAPKKQYRRSYESSQVTVSKHNANRRSPVRNSTFFQQLTQIPFIYEPHMYDGAVCARTRAHSPVAKIVQHMIAVIGGSLWVRARERAAHSREWKWWWCWWW